MHIFFDPSVQVPILETERLRLRGHRMEDFSSSAAMWADPKVTCNLGVNPLTREDAWTRFLRYIGHWSLMGFGYWVIEEKENGEFVGEIGFADYKRDLVPSLNGTPEIGWVLASSTHGQGFATEAAHRVLAWGDANFTPARTACMITPENLASIRVAAKCGFQEVQKTTYKGHTVLLFIR